MREIIMKTFARPVLSFSLIGAVFGLVACSSGGDGGSGFTAPNISHTPVAITTENESEVAQAGFDGANGGLALGSGAQNIIPGAVIVDSSAASKNTNLYSTVKKLLDNALDKGAQQQNAVSVTGAQFSGTESCAYQDPVTGQMMGSGSESFNASIADFNEVTEEPNSFTSGDYMSVAFNNCDYGDGEVQNGSMTITFNSNASQADITAEVFSLDVTFNVNNLTTTSQTFGTETIHGTIDLSLDVNGTNVAFDMSGNSLYAVSEAESVHLTNFSFVATTDGVSTTVDSSFTVASSALNGQITVDSHFESTTGNYPTTGYMNITGNNSQLNISVNGNGTVEVMLTINGNPEVDYPKDVAWSELGIEVDNAF